MQFADPDRHRDRHSGNCGEYRPVLQHVPRASPALADYDGLPQLYWTSPVNDNIKYSTFNGASWSAPATVSGPWRAAGTSAGPAVPANGSLLAVGWKGTTNYPPAIAALPSGGVPLAFAWTEPSGSIGYGALTILGFETEGPVPQAATNVSPALAFAGNWSTQEFEPQAKTLQRPALAVNGNVLPAGWTGQTTSNLYCASAENPY